MLRVASAALVAAMLVTFPALHARADGGLPLSREDQSKLLDSGTDPAAQFRALAAIVRRPMSDNGVIVPWLEQNADRLQPMLLMELSRRLFDQSHANSLEWFAIAQARTIYDAKRCTDPSATDGMVLIFLRRLAGEQVTSYVRSHPDEYDAAQKRALARADLFADGATPLWICGHGLSAYGQAITGQGGGSQVKPREEWPALQQSVREAMATAVERAETARAARKALPAGTIELRIPHKGIPFALAWTPDGKRLAMSLNGDPHLAIWDIESRSIVREIDRGFASVDPIAFVDQGHAIVALTADQGRADRTAAITVFNAVSGATVRHFATTSLDNPAGFAVDDTGQTIAYLSKGRPEHVALAHLDAAAATSTLSVERDMPEALAFGPGGILAVGTISGKIAIFDTRKGLLTRTIAAFDDDNVVSLAFSPDGRFIAAGAEGGKRGTLGPDRQMHYTAQRPTLKVWSATDGAVLLSCFQMVKTTPDTIWSVAWSPDNRHFASTGFDKVRLWDIDSPQHAKVLMQFLQTSAQYSSAALAFSPDGRRLAMTGDNVALIVPIADGGSQEISDDASCK